MPAKKKFWSGKVTRESHALNLENKVFTKKPKGIARSLKRSAEHSQNKKTTAFRSAMSMLNFYINRAGRSLTPGNKARLQKAKDELRQLFHRPYAKLTNRNQTNIKGSH